MSFSGQNVNAKTYDELFGSEIVSLELKNLRWSTVALDSGGGQVNTPTPRYCHGSVCCLGTLLVFGGSSGSGVLGSKFLSDTWLYDTQSQKWRSEESGQGLRSTPRNGMTLTQLMPTRCGMHVEAKVVMFGGGILEPTVSLPHNIVGSIDTLLFESFILCAG